MAFRGVELSQHHATWPGPPVAVTGATGKVGALVAAELRARGSEPRLIVRDPARLPTPAPDVRVAEFADSRAVEAALRGVRTVLMVSASCTTGTTRPRGDWAAKPRFTWPCRTIPGRRFHTLHPTEGVFA